MLHLFSFRPQEQALFRCEDGEWVDELDWLLYVCTNLLLGQRHFLYVKVSIDKDHFLADINCVLACATYLIEDLQLFRQQIQPVVTQVKDVGLEEGQLLGRLEKPSLDDTLRRDHRLSELIDVGPSARKRIP